MINLKKIERQKCFQVIWCLLGIYILWQFGYAMARSASLPGRVRKGLLQYNESTAKDEQTPPSKPQQAQASKNPFAPPSNLTMPKCMAVLGDEALINEKWYKIGSTVGGAKIVAINSESVKILWEEKEHTLIPFDVEVQYAANTKKPSGDTSKRNKSEAPPGQNESNPNRRSSGMGRPEGVRGPGMASPEDRRRMYERYQNASPEEQAEMRREMRERFSGRGRGQGGGRPDRSRER